ncbi:MAG: helix-turn-helix domain-containing protein [Azonexus sp.]|nr:helix-turn-helix domain-containing protein [Azonexus sp.]
MYSSLHSGQQPCIRRERAPKPNSCTIDKRGPQQAHPAGATAAPFSFEHKSTRDSDQHAESLAQWDQTYDQLSPGPFAGEVVELWFKGIQIFRETTNRSVFQNGAPWQNCHIIGIPVAMSGPGLFCRQQVNMDSVFTFQSEQGFSLTTPEEFDVIGIAIPDTTLAELESEGCNIRQLIPDRPSLLVPNKNKLDELRACLTSVLDPQHFQQELLCYPQVQRSMHSAIIGHILETLEQAHPAPMPALSFKARSHLVNAAIDYAQSRPSDPPTVQELCSKLNISSRLLNYYFQEILGSSPHHYLCKLRLNGVRRELRAAAPQAAIRDIAAQWGFSHQPRFAAEYRALFGELPSATVKQRQAH